MNSNKIKNVGLFLSVGILGCACVGGIVAGIYFWNSSQKQEAKIVRSISTLKSLENRGAALALSEENLEKETESYNILLSVSKEKIERFNVRPKLESDFKGDRTTFKSMLQERYQEWKKILADGKIKIDASNYLGFSRYLTGGFNPKEDTLGVLMTEANIVDFLLKKLAESKQELLDGMKDAGVALNERNQLVAIEALLREVVEEAQEKEEDNGRSFNRNRSRSKDEFLVRESNLTNKELLRSTNYAGNNYQYVTLREEGVMKAYSIQLVLTTNTRVVRNFLNSLQDTSFYLRDIVVEPAKKESLNRWLAKAAPIQANTLAPVAESSPFDVFGDAPAAPVVATAPKLPKKPTRVVVVEENLSTFSMTLEYVVPILFKENTEEGEKVEK